VNGGNGGNSGNSGLIGAHMYFGVFGLFFGDPHIYLSLFRYRRYRFGTRTRGTKFKEECLYDF
jgi:hypothetical protein